jgi:type VI secretion system protein VasD
MRTPSRAAAALFAAAVVGSSGCGLFSSGSGETPAPIDVQVSAAPRLNPDEQGEPLPTLVRLYQLKGPARIEAAEFDVLYRDEKAALGDDLLQMDEVTVDPGSSVRRQLARHRDARVLAAVAVVRRPSGQSWRSVVTLPGARDAAKLAFGLEDYRLVRR